MNRRTKVTKDLTSVDPITSNITTTPNITKTEYYKTGWIKSITDANNHTTSFEYDGVGRITKQTAADGGKTEYTYNDIRELEYVTLKLSDDTVFKNTKYDYDDAQRIVEMKDVLSDGNLATTTSYTYSLYGANPTPEITTTVKGSGQTRVTVDKYDRYQRLIESKNPIGTITANKYFDDGQIKSTTVTGLNSLGGLADYQTQFEYDGLGRQNKVIDALDRSTSMDYDLVGNLTKMTDANQHSTNHTYDSLNRKTTSTISVDKYNVDSGALVSLNLATKYYYDKNSNLTSITDAQGRIVTNKYDELNRRTASIITNPLDSLDIPITTSRIKYDGVGNVLESTDANGHTTKYEYDDLNRQNKVTDALGKVVSQKAYDAAGRVTSSKNMYGVETTTAYNNPTHQMTMTNPLGSSYQWTDAFGNVVKTTDAAVRTNTYEYDDKLNRQTRATDYLGGVVSYAYDGFNNLISQQDASQNTTYYEYDKLNRRTNTKDSLGQISRVEYDAVGNKTREYLTVNNGEERLNTYQYDALNRQYAMTTAVGSTAAATSWTGYDHIGNIIGSKDALNRISKSSYDKLNRQTAVTQASGTIDETTSRYQYDAVGNRLSETNGRGYITKYEYDELNRQIEIIDAYDNQTETEYFNTSSSVAVVLAELSLTNGNANVGKVVKTTDAKGNKSYVLYDKFDRQIETIDAIKHRTSARKYDAVDRVIESTDTFGQKTTYTYLDAARQKVTVDPFLGTTTELFDAAGNLIKVTDPLNRSTSYTYDKRDRQTKIKDANGGETEYSYFKDGKTASIKDAVGNLTEYSYDLAGRLIEEKTGFGSRKYQYDLVNNRIQGTDRNERVTNYGYDSLNRIKTEAWADGSKTFTYSYDKNSNRLTGDDGSIRYEYGYDHTDLVTQVDSISGTNPTVSFKYGYDEIGNLIGTEELVGSVVQATTAYEYDDPRYLNTRITQTGVGLANKEVKFTYDSAGSNTKIERYLDGLLKVSTTNAFDVHGRLTGIAQANAAGTPISDDVYVLDNLNRLQAQTKGGQLKEIVYDDTDQVQTVTGGAGEAYTYDLNGNRTGGGYTTGVDNRLTSDGTYSYQYDPEGNRKSRTNIVTNAVDEYAWDYRNRLTGIVSKDSGGAVIKTVGYTYDVDDQRVSKTVTTGTGSTTEKYYLDGNQIAFVTDGGGNQTFHYLYGLNVDQVMAQDSPTGMVWALADRLGSVDTLTDGEGVVVDKRTFDSFGRVLSESNPSVSFRYGYTGRELDLESGLNYYRARYYDSQVGRFISVDPMGFGAGDTNLYRYVGNNSTNATDPSGELIQVVVGGAILGGLSAAAYGLADHFERGGSWNNIDLQDIGEKASIGAFVGATAAGVFALGGLAVGTNTATTIGTAATITSGGFQIRSAFENFANDRPLTGFLDLTGAGFAGLSAGRHLPPGSNGFQFAGGFGSKAIAIGASEPFAGQAGLLGGAIGGKANELFQHYLAMSNGDGSSSGSGQSSSDPQEKNVQQLLENHLPSKQSVSIAKMAKKVGLLSEIEQLMQSGKLTNPELLHSMLGKITSTKNDEGSIAGLRNELRFISTQSQSQRNSSVTIKGGADFILEQGQSTRAIQLKTVSSENANGFSKRLEGAARQLSGSTGEKPPIGSNKEIHIYVENTSPMHNADRAKLLVDINKQLSSNIKGSTKTYGSNVDTVVVNNSQGTFVYTKNNQSNFH